MIKRKQMYWFLKVGYLTKLIDKSNNKYQWVVEA